VVINRIDRFWKYKSFGWEEGVAVVFKSGESYMHIDNDANAWEPSDWRMESSGTYIYLFKRGSGGCQ